MSRLSEKVAIVTGASKGIGGGIATAFGAAGARVAVNYSSDREGADRVAQAITDNGGQAIREYIGGSCPNIACLPSKNIIHSAKIADYFRRSKEFGIAIGKAGFTVEMSGVRDRKRKMVVGLNEMYMENYRKTGAEFILGSGRFVAPRTLEVDLPDGSTRHLRGTNLIVSTGTRASLESIPGLAEAHPLTHIEALELDQVPEHLLVIGGGYVGVELSQAMRRFGSKVTVIDRNGRLMSKEDPDVCEALGSLLADEGIDILLSARIKQVSGKSGDSVSVVVEQNGIEKVVKGSHVLVATGRTPNTEGLGLELAGVELTDRGYIKVNERLQTTAPGVWAIGEVAGSPQFTHISIDDFRVVHANLTGGNRVTTGGKSHIVCLSTPNLLILAFMRLRRKRKAFRIAFSRCRWKAICVRARFRKRAGS
jgi:pyruvate/2-oxoglutarate dehydrogenase complex dihydrolipoamide dehydrogenase (E3) component